MEIFILAIRCRFSETQIYEFEGEGLLQFLMSFEMDCSNKEDFDFALALGDWDEN